ncbi:MAG: hypothetical protein R2710_23040 [Acidimicrobiales bacterium]
MDSTVIKANILKGGSISSAQFELRHRIITIVLAAHTPVPLVIGLASGYAWWHAIIESLPPVGSSPSTPAPDRRDTDQVDGQLGRSGGRCVDPRAHPPADSPKPTSTGSSCCRCAACTSTSDRSSPPWSTPSCTTPA